MTEYPVRFLYYLFSVEIDEVLPSGDFESGRCFNNAVNESTPPNAHRAFKPVVPRSENTKRGKRPSFKMPSNIGNNKRISVSSQSKKPLKMERDPSTMRNPLVLNNTNLNDDFTPIQRKDNDERAGSDQMSFRSLLCWISIPFTSHSVTLWSVCIQYWFRNFFRKNCGSINV